MRRPEKILLILLFAAVLAVYFLTEAILRQATVARINPDAVNAEDIIAKLPAKMQDDIRERITLTALRGEVRKAETPAEKLNAKLVLAAFVREQNEKAELYEEILEDHRELPASYPAYVYFMFNGNAEYDRVSYDDFHKFQKDLPVVERYYAWVAAFGKMQENKQLSPQDRCRFLKPLLEYKDPPFLEYYALYSALKDLALAAGDAETANAAARLADQVTFCRSFSEYMMQLEEDLLYRNELQNRKTGK
ncbi:MAG: hypothetical protein IKM17_06375 [Lentisphaeria bacterium]|nr:hypothetical protein [Lentisphaeria bacterium]